MMKTLSHWGILAECEAMGALSPLKAGKKSPEPDIILTMDGEILVHKAPRSQEVALLLDRHLGHLTSAQQSRMLALWNLAHAVAGPNVTLRPMPAALRYQAENYLARADWEKSQMSSINSFTTNKGERPWTQCS